MKYDCLDLNNIVAFDWDEGNIDKNELKHGLSWKVIEEIFFNEPLILAVDVKHSQDECRCFALGKTDTGDKLFVVFTLRARKLRVISARSMNKKERNSYENSTNI